MVATMEPKRKSGLSWPVVCVLVLLGTPFAALGGVSLYGYARWRYWPPDALFALLLIDDDTTQWGAGFSESGFNSVEAGMTIAEVKAILGEPVRVWPRPDGSPQSFWYGASHSHSNYHYRSVFFQDGFCTRTKREYYID
jgi:hypothetical protein